MSDQLLERLEALGPDEWRPEPPPPLMLPPVAPRRRRALTLRPLPALAAALVLLALGGGLGALLARTGDDAADRSVPLAPLTRGGAADGELRLGPAGKRATLVATGLQPSRRGEFYELWFLRPDGALVALGSFRVGEDGRARVSVPVPVDPTRYRFVDVSVERDDGDPSHSSRSVLRGRVD